MNIVLVHLYLSFSLSLSRLCLYLYLPSNIYPFLSFSLFFFLSQVLCGPRVNPCLRSLFCFFYLYTSLCISLYPSHFVYFSRSFKQYLFLSFFLFRFRGSFFNKKPKAGLSCQSNLCAFRDFVPSLGPKDRREREREKGRESWKERKRQRVIERER
jgi:hypothetical protein